MRSCSLNSMAGADDLILKLILSDHCSDFLMDVSCKARCRKYGGAKPV